MYLNIFIFISLFNNSYLIIFGPTLYGHDHIFSLSFRFCKQIYICLQKSFQAFLEIYIQTLDWLF